MNHMEEQLLYRAAMSYAKAGLAVFPLEERGKKPRTKNGCKDATTDAAQVKAWWQQWPNANIGIATGKKSGGIFVIDLDIDENKGLDGYHALQDWERENGSFPDSWMSITGRGGYHLYFKSDTEIKNRAGIIDGIDVRGEGGYVVAPPSIHSNGRRYEWEYSPEEYELVEADEAVKAFLNQKSDEQGKTFIMPEQVEQGNRNDILFKVACALQEKGMSDVAILNAVMAENQERCKPPLDEKEVRILVNSALKYEKGDALVACDKGKTRKVKHTDFRLSKATDVEIKEPEWLVQGYIPKYGITTIAGEGGVAKTTLWVALVAAATTGNPFFMLGENGPIPFYHEKPLNVVVFSAEDSWEYVLKKRLQDNGADLNRVSFMGPNDERFAELNFNGDLLKGIVETNRPDLIIFDPVQAFVPEHLRMGDRNAMRKCFSPLIGFGETYGTTCIVIAHANKQSGVWGRKRIADSSDIWDASRSVLMVGMVPNSDGLRYISHEKSNWGKLQDSVIFDLQDGVPVFKTYTKHKDREFVQEDSKIKQTNNSAVDVAKDFIMNVVYEHKQMEIKELDELAKACGISSNALKDAKAALSQEKQTHTWSIGYGRDKKYFITLKDTENINE